MQYTTTAEIINVTPEMALDWLNNSFEGQRHIRKKHVERITADMRNNRWITGPDAIVLISGKLANGQHRLSGLVKAKTSQTFLVLKSDNPELYKVIDAGIKRTVTDGLGDMECRHEIPAIARWVKAYYDGGVRVAAMSGGGAGKDRAMSQIEMIDYVVANRHDLIPAAHFIRGIWFRTKLLQASIAGAIHVIGNKAGKREQVEKFLMQVYCGGEGVVGELRNRLIASMGTSKKLRPGYVFNLTMKALSYYLKGEQPQRLIFKEGDKPAEI